jgi:hypothetical protein
MTKQIFEEDMTAEILHSMFVPVEGTNLTIAILPVATTVDNGECFYVYLVCVCDSIRNTSTRLYHTLKIFFIEKPNKTLVLIEMMLPFSYTPQRHLESRLAKKYPLQSSISTRTLQPI